MSGRFTHLLDELDRAKLAAGYTPSRPATEDDVVAVQLSFPPRRPHNENVTGVPHSCPTWPRLAALATNWTKCGGARQLLTDQRTAEQAFAALERVDRDAAGAARAAYESLTAGQLWTSPPGTARRTHPVPQHRPRRRPHRVARTGVAATVGPARAVVTTSEPRPKPMTGRVSNIR